MHLNKDIIRKIYFTSLKLPDVDNIGVCNTIGNAVYEIEAGYGVILRSNLDSGHCQA